jgi:hypothetical protein
MLKGLPDTERGKVCQTVKGLTDTGRGKGCQTVKGATIHWARKGLPDGKKGYQTQSGERTARL